MIIQEQLNNKSLPCPNIIQMVLSNVPPATYLVTAVHCLLFFEERLVLTRLENRGWEIPGGHIEEREETIIEALKREVLEEAGAYISSETLIGYEKITLLGSKLDGYPYPYPSSYQLFFAAKAEKFVKINDPTGQAKERYFLDLNNECDKKSQWVVDHYQLCLAAYNGLFQTKKDD
ncbi:NUDIX domain-containing protein [Shouchella clausii]|uniref:NUDIX domain-containing protein n=1 Tax=Shouchella clausii TaxID=79880 RepID=UPI0015CCE3E1|nr:NUDIX domain-containing protein [Shouchella clausii]